MRVRIRSKDSGETKRVEVPGTSTVRHLIDEVRRSLGERLEPESEILLSLNKKDPLQGDSEATLTSLGVCNGDLVWLLSPIQPENPSEDFPQDCPMDPPKPPSPPAAPGHTLASQPQFPTNTRPISNRSSPGQEQSPRIQEGGGGGGNSKHGGAESMEIDPGGAEQGGSNTVENHDSEDSGSDIVPVGLGIPGHLLRVLCSNPELTASSHGVAVLLSHAAMLETVFQVARIKGELRVGGVSGGGGISEGDNNYSVPSSSAIASTTHRILYTLRASPQVECMLTCSSMGQSTVVAASAPGDRARSVQLASPVIEATSSTVAGKIEERQVVPGAPHISCAAHCQEVVLHSKLAVRPSTLRALWNTLKDGIALPMQAACCIAAGLPAPVGLAALPIEIKTRILGALEPLDLASLSCTCAELRHLVGGNDLWEPLFKAHFPMPPYYVTELLQRRGYKWAYGHCWSDRRRREKEAARRRRRFAPAIPHFGQRPPFYPARAPPGFPGSMIGGDQDRLPFLGGTGSHGTGIGSPFRLFRGASNARRQGGGGPSWF